MISLSNLDLSIDLKSSKRNLKPPAASNLIAKSYLIAISY
jgi:hypothetical protein